MGNSKASDGQEAKPQFEIPPPKPAETQASDAISFAKAFEEFRGFSSGKLRRETWDWWLAFSIKIALFVIVIALNIWWDRSILRMLRQSGQVDSKFHLDNSVLIALVTTSIGNFLALVFIVAKHVFPGTASNK